MKQGTTAATAAKMTSASKSSRSGPSNKNLATGAMRKPAPKGPTTPIKGSDKGGV